MTAPADATVTWGVLLLGALLVSMGGLTLARSAATASAARRRTRAAAAVRTDLLDRLNRDEPAWDEWVATLDRTERTALEERLLAFFRRLSGGDRERLRALARELDLDERAERALRGGTRTERLRGLTWLAYLDVEVDPEELRARCGDHPTTRAAAARVLHEREHPAAAEVGTDLLLGAGEPLPVLGIDTLYQLHKLDPERLVDYAASRYGAWSESLLIQVLDVLAECDPVPSPVSLDWVADCLDASSPRIREAALRALADYGWRADVRRAANVGVLTRDPAPNVRIAAYRLLGEWEPEIAASRLADGLATDADARARLAAAEALYGAREVREDGRRGAERPAIPAGVEAWAWVVATEGGRS
ncbi:HEAT repeat domain-containing protein [Halomarina pelagica]|uniref:HEAT repeat domain-containing protein n=1 Tax=Halomarina pelagica TaxID=2961599 RepID=UPI0020C57906|nr:HEAT repeat domain-containing protein [Halomarina sp. BND7]